jgi:ureidoacrylate peracid hydrolase
MFRDYSCVVLEDCTAEPMGAEHPRTNHEASLLVIETLFGWVSNARAVLEALAGRSSSPDACELPPSRVQNKRPCLAGPLE